MAHIKKILKKTIQGKIMGQIALSATVELLI